MRSGAGRWAWLDQAIRQFTRDASGLESRQAHELETYGESLDAIGQVCVRDNGEPLIDLRALRPPLAFCQLHPWGAGYRRQFFVREAVAEMLGKAQKRLPAGYRLLIIEGYRPAIVQRRMFEGLYWYLQALHPEWSKEQLQEATNVFIASPDVAAPAPHSTGGAVDLTLVDAAGKPVDTTSPLGWNEASAATASDGISPEARAHRQILNEALTESGLTNYPGEWWHWSYGEPGWAVRTRQATAIYGPLTSAYGLPAGAAPEP